MKKLIFDFVESFKNTPAGFAARKLSAFWAIVIMGTIVTIKYGSPENAVEMLLIWLSFGLLCLAVVTIQNIIDFRTGSTTRKETSIKIQETKTPEP